MNANLPIDNVLLVNIEPGSDTYCLSFVPNHPGPIVSNYSNIGVFYLYDSFSLRPWCLKSSTTILIVQWS
jgi:hypothetical protein